MKKPKHMLTGIAIGDYKFHPETMIDEIKEYGDGNPFNYLSMKTMVPDRNKEPITKEFLFDAAKYMREHEIYFTVRSDYRAIMSGPDPLYDKDVVKKLQEIAGEYFLGNEILEFGGFYATKAKGYRLVKKPSASHSEYYLSNPVPNIQNAKEAKESYIRKLREIICPMREAGTELVSALEAVTLFPYAYEAGVDFCTVEVAPRNMEQILAFARGAQRAYRKNVLGGWCAHDWYGGNRNDDPLKPKRLKLDYMSSYIAGLDFICLESGYRAVNTFGDNYPEDHPITKENMRITREFAEFTKTDERIGLGPVTKVAFVQGNLDGFGWGNSSSLWGQYESEKWGFAAPEFSYRVLDDVYRSAEWHNTVNFGDYDYSHSPAFGQYDVIPATTPLDVMKQYEWVIFCGWNTMTQEISQTLKEYVKSGGKLLITAAHIRTGVDRDKKGEFLDTDWEEFLGARLTDEIIRTNDGFKFERDSIVEGILYPGTKTLMCDPCWSAGYTDYVKLEPTLAHVAAWIADSFAPAKERMFPAVIENKYGSGNVIFMANSEYPGAPEIFPLYRMMVKAALSASHRTSELKVIGSDKIRFAVYENEKKYKIYLLNTDYNFEQRVRVIYMDKSVEKVINSTDFDILEFEKQQ